MDEEAAFNKAVAEAAENAVITWKTCDPKFILQVAQGCMETIAKTIVIGRGNIQKARDERSRKNRKSSS